MTKLNFTYNYGRGRLEIILDNLLPCTPADFKRLLSFVQLSERPEDHAAVIFEYISGCVAELQKEREKYNPDSAYAKPQRARINAAIKKHISNAAQLSKVYGFPEIEDDAAKIVYKSATVYAIITNDAGKAIAESFNGWTFQKSGYVFDVYKDKRRKAYYHILLHDTGLGVVTVTNRNQAADAITPRVLEVLENAADKMEAMQEDFKHHMIAAGFMEDDERAENISSVEAKTENNTENEEVNTMTNYEFTKDTITIDGVTYPVEYEINNSGSGYVGITCEAKSVWIPSWNPDYEKALAAAREALNGEEAKPEQKRPEIISEATPAAKVEDKPKPETPQPEIVYTDENGARDPKAARGPVPEKTFIGSVIEGRGWKILFDGIASRTRVIFESDPTDAARAAIENAGFYYSPNMKSWNKKLTFRAYRAAQTLSCRLNELYAA